MKKAHFNTLTEKILLYNKHIFSIYIFFFHSSAIIFLKKKFIQICFFLFFFLAFLIFVTLLGLQLENSSFLPFPVSFWQHYYCYWRTNLVSNW